MSNPFRTRPQFESLDARITPSDTGVLNGPPAFTGLNVAVEQFYPTDPISPVAVSPVFALNYNPTGVESLPALPGLNVAAVQYPTDPISPVFFGLAGLDDGGGDTTPL
jgi:hypothetical protein